MIHWLLMCAIQKRAVYVSALDKTLNIFEDLKEV